MPETGKQCPLLNIITFIMKVSTYYIFQRFLSSYQMPASLSAISQLKFRQHLDGIPVGAEKEIADPRYCGHKKA